MSEARGTRPPAADPLVELLHELSRNLPGTTGTTTRPTAAGSTSTWSLGERTFAVAVGGEVELRLDPAVAAAALKTPDTAPSERGPEWVRYAPRTLEGHDLDRLTAWFGLAHRRASQQAGRASR